MKLWRFECQKLWKNKLICGLLFVCFFLNAIFLYKQTTNYDVERRCFPDVIKGVYEELEEIPEQKKMIWLNEELERAIEASSVYDLEPVGEMDTVERKIALDNVLEYVQKVYGYEAYLDGIKEQAKLISGSSLFAQKDLFSKRNAQLIPEKYQHLQDLKLDAENSQGVLLATESKMTDIFLVIFIIMLAYFFICMEREEGTMAFARSTRYGGKPLGKTKITVILVGSLLGALILYVSNIIIAGIIYGMGDLGRWIQSVEGYIASPLKLTVGSYLAFFLLGKLFATAVIAAVVIWIVLWGKSILKISTVLLVVTAVEYGLYSAIPLHSWLDVLRQCNLFYFIKTEQFFKNYETMNLFSYPMSSMVVCGVIGVVIVIAALWFGVVSYEKVSQSEYTQKKLKKYMKRSQKSARTHSLLYYEAFKILWVGGAGILMVVFLIIQFLTYSGEKAYFSLDELYYKNYMEQLEGDVIQEKLDFIEAEGQRIQKIREEFDALEEKAEGMSQKDLEDQRSKLNKQLSCQTAFNQIQEQEQRIGSKGVFLNEVGYAYLLDKKEQVFQIGKLLIIWILAFYSVFILEEMARMPAIWNAIPNGRRKIQRRKRMLLAGCIVLLCVASDAVFIIYRMKAQGLCALNYPIQYLPEFGGWKHLSILGYLVGNCILKIILGGLVCGVIVKISKKAKNATTVLLVSGSIGGILYMVLNIIMLV